MAAIAARDLRVVTKSSAVLVPIVVVPMVFLVGLPLLVGWLPRVAGPSMTAGNQLATLLTRASPAVAARLAGLPPEAQVPVLLLTSLMAPMFLVLPLMVASVIAADSFAGEKERKTLEALLYTPTSDAELMLGKVAAAVVPAVLVSWFGLVLYSVVTDLVTYPMVGAPLLPDALWLVLGLWLSPAVAGLGLGVTVLVSARVRSFQEAYQLGGVVVLPVVALVAAQAAGLVTLSAWAVLAGGAVLYALDAVLLALGLARFSRDALASRA